jgi:5-methylcytosine-specific restriction endonuclease McrA
MAISKRVRYEVLRRDGHRCRYCGAAAPEVALTVEHVVPQALGGRNDPHRLLESLIDGARPFMHENLMHLFWAA